ncbi:MAG: M48 family metallopeptidase [archaeon]|nr:M48 family metallopeptidase [archaeon]
MKKKNKKSNSKDIRAFSEKLKRILEDLQHKRDFEIRGQLRIGVVTNLDALAIIKGNRIYVNFNARRYPRPVLQYILSHEIAHIISKHHRRKFWEIVARINPDYQDGREKLLSIQATSSKNL